MDLYRNTLPAIPYFSDLSVTSNTPGATLRLVAGKWEVQADRNRGHAIVALAPAKGQVVFPVPGRGF